MTTQKRIISGLIALSTVALGTFAFAQSTTSPMAVTIDSAGHTALSGTVSAVLSPVLSVSSWLGTWTVSTSSATSFMPNTTFADIKVGDVVKVAGTLGTGMAINATAVKDDALKPAPLQKDREDEKDNNGKHKGWFNMNWNGFFGRFFKKG